jgi:anti-repressor protein
MNDLQIFKNPKFGELRTTIKDGEPWFAATDVCTALEVGNPSQALARLDTDERFTTLISNEGAASGKSQMSFVSEAGLYSLALSSRKPQAKPFKRWVTHEVIPSIRKHGAYMTPETIEKALLNPDTIIRLATELKAEREQRKALESKVEADKPKVLFADAVATSESPMLIGELAKVLKQNGVDIGEKRLFGWMRENGYLIKRKGTDYNAPTQKSMEMGLFRVKETAITHSDGHVTVNRTTKVTGKGQQYFINKFLGEKSA